MAQTPSRRIGYTLMGEQSDPRWLVKDAVRAEAVGFDFEVTSDHFFPWLEAQGHAPYTWAVLGAVTQVTEQVELMTYVTCPSFRYHPVVVAQKAATLGLLSEGRFTLGLGAGENLNEHVVGEGWPTVEVRHERFVEALEIIDALFDGTMLDYAGRHFQVSSARLWDLPEQRVPIAVAVSGERSVEALAPLADHMVATDPKPELREAWDAARTGTERAGDPSRQIGQLPVCWDADRDAAVKRAHEQFRWFGGGWSVNADLPTTAGFAAASQFVREEDVAESIPCGDDVAAVVEAAGKFWEAGFTDLALVQIGGEHQDAFLDAAKAELLPALREAAAGS